MPSITKAERAEAIERLRAWVKPGDTIHCILRHVSRSGMQRVIQLVRIAPRPEGEGRHYDNGVEVAHLGYNVAKALGMRYDRQREGVVIGGCGMDMGFALVYDLARTLWPDGYGCIGEGCPSNDHSNGDRDYTPHRDCTKCMAGDAHAIHDGSGDDGKGHWHRDGGYFLNARWL